MIFLKELRKSIILNAVFASIGAVLFTLSYVIYVAVSIYDIKRLSLLSLSIIGWAIAGIYVVWGVTRLTRHLLAHAPDFLWMIGALGIGSFMLAHGDVEAFYVVLPVIAVYFGFSIGGLQGDFGEAIRKILSALIGTSGKIDKR